MFQAKITKLMHRLFYSSKAKAWKISLHRRSLESFAKDKSQKLKLLWENHAAHQLYLKMNSKSSSSMVAIVSQGMQYKNG